MSHDTGSGGNGRSLNLMTEQEFVDADPDTAQRWTYRILRGMCHDIKTIKTQAKISDKIWSFAGGMVGGAVAVYVFLKAKIITFG